MNLGLTDSLFALEDRQPPGQRRLRFKLEIARCIFGGV